MHLPHVICQFACVPLRVLPDLVSEMMTQVLHGETADVLETKGHFLKVQLHHDGYLGWVDARHFTPSGTATHATWFVGDAFGNLVSEKRRLLVPLGTPLPHYDGKTCRVAGTEYTYTGLAHEASRMTPSSLLTWGETLLHSPYLWGGRTPAGIDCSGLAQLVHRLGGVAIKRDTVDQIHQGHAVETLAETQMGDLVFFHGDGHVGIVWEQGKIFHASGSVRIDHLVAAGIQHTDTGELTHKLKCIRRCGLMRE